VEGVGKLLYSSSDLAKIKDAPKRYDINSAKEG
jgi:hypothetical protein